MEDFNQQAPTPGQNVPPPALQPVQGGSVTPRPPKLPWAAILIFFFFIVFSLIFVFALGNNNSNNETRRKGAKKLSDLAGSDLKSLTKDAIITKFGAPKEATATPMGMALLYDSGISGLPNTVVYNGETQKLEGLFLSVPSKEEGESLYQEMLKLGKPEKEMYSTYLQGSKIYIFSSRGISYSANAAVKMVDSIHKYPPTSLSGYLAKYGKFFSETDPYQF